VVELAGNVFDDACVGTVDLTYKEGADPSVGGTAVCEFTGTLGTILKGEQVAVVEGSDTKKGAEGTLNIDVAGKPFIFEWTGAASADEVTGAFTGSADVEIKGFPMGLDYAGGFRGIPE